MVTFSMTFTGP